MSTAPTGRFITFEGGEGVGKTTQIAILADFLQADGHEVVTTREPGGSAGGEAIRQLLLHAPDDAWRPAAESLLFAAARSDHVERVIRPALARGAWVLCDRYVDSTRAYQSVGGAGLSDADIMTLHRIGSGGLLPHRTLLLTLSPEAALLRRRARGQGDHDRFEARDAAFHGAVFAAFAAIAAAEPERVRTIDAAGAPDAVAAVVRAAVQDLL